MSRTDPTSRAGDGGTPARWRGRGGVRSGRAASNSLMAQGTPMVWLTGGALAVCVVMIVGLLLLVLVQGAATFWPAPVTELRRVDGTVLMGEITRTDAYTPREDEIASVPTEALPRAGEMLAAQEGVSERRLVRTGNFEISGTHFDWVSDFEIAEESRPEWAVVFERLSWGRFYGVPDVFRIDGEDAATGAEGAWRLFEEHHGESRRRWRERRRLETHAIGEVNRRLESERLALRQIELDHGRDSAPWAAARARLNEVESRLNEEFLAIRARIDELNRENGRYELVVRAADGQTAVMRPFEIVRAYPANRLDTGSKIALYLSRWREFIADDPREANSEGGVFPAIFGTVVMTLIMSVAVVPFGVLAALYLREYAKAGPMVSAVRIAVNNLAGVPSIVFGVFGLGFFCYLVGGTIDQVFFEAKLPSPTFGTGGIFWASLTLALLTLPVVIVATEEALAAVPSSMRDGSYACGASKWQTIRRIVLPRAMPGIMTGTILAMARGAGEVAPLMLVGAVKLAPELPVDGVFPYVHPERSFMHLGFHIYDLGFQSQNSEAAKPMVFTTTLLLIALIAALNLLAVWIRTRLRRRFTVSAF